MAVYAHLPKLDDSLNTSRLTLGIEFSAQDLTALARDVGILKASGWMESNSSVLSQIILANEVFLTLINKIKCLSTFYGICFKSFTSSNC